MAWRLANGALERVAWPELDGAAPLTPAAMVTNVIGVHLRYRIGGAWSDRWEGRGPTALPQAAEITISRRDGTHWRELFLVGPGTSPASTVIQRAS